LLCIKESEGKSKTPFKTPIKQTDKNNIQKCSGIKEFDSRESMLKYKSP